MRKLIIILLILVGFLLVLNSASYYSSNFSKKDKPNSTNQVKVITEESVAINAVNKIGPAVVTIVEEAPQRNKIQFGPFSVFEVNEQQIEPVNIGTGFVIDALEGLIITNKHVVANVSAKYQVVTSNDKKYSVQKVFRDPLNDLAILKINPLENPDEALKSAELGSSSKLQVGQFVVAIGTALGEFKNTVTTGVISGLGRGITTGSAFQGYVEKLDNVIQTDAAINPGNSGGPLVNSSAQVIGINTAIASGGQNIGFALPINTVRDSLKNFKERGEFNRPYLGVSYKMISRDLAIINNIAQGAYIQEVVGDSPAQKAGVNTGDIITKIDNKKVESGDNELSAIIASKKTGQTINLTIWRNGVTLQLKTILTNASE
ncbi:trypsin-like peptidase domain-containing protein [Patescibacteria group bacterium]|nr:trypsin-like peptidase domain-containing protein [Patescibacteria group bacterium]